MACKGDCLTAALRILSDNCRDGLRRKSSSSSSTSVIILVSLSIAPVRTLSVRYSRLLESSNILMDIFRTNDDPPGNDFQNSLVEEKAATAIRYVLECQRIQRACRCEDIRQRSKRLP